MVKNGVYLSVGKESTLPPRCGELERNSMMNVCENACFNVVRLQDTKRVLRFARCILLGVLFKNVVDPLQKQFFFVSTLN